RQRHELSVQLRGTVARPWRMGAFFVVEMVRSRGSEIAVSPDVLRITLLGSAAGEGLLLEGRLAGAWVDVLREACRRHGTRTLDLRGLQTVDVEGLTLLRQLALDGVELEHLSGYVAALLAEPS